MASSSVFFFFILWALLLPLLTFSGPLYFHSIAPNFTSSYFQYIDHSGAFLVSSNSTFKASFTNQSQLSVFHDSSNTIVWSTVTSLPASSKLSLTVNGLTITNETDHVFWSTPKLQSRVAALRLLETGNLVLADEKNASLWQSFDYPVDTLVVGQRLSVGKALSSATGGYRLMVTNSDAVLQWNGMTYWKLSMDTKAYKDSNAEVAFMAVNGTGLYLFAGDELTVVIQVSLAQLGFRIAKIDTDGRFIISSFIGESWTIEFSAPVEHCQLPLICGRLGLCTRRAMSGTCLCPRGFRNGGHLNGECIPADKSVSLPSDCNSSVGLTELNSSVSYLKLDDGMDYFANALTEPVKRGVSLSVCKGLCSENCSCLGIFHGNSSGSCYFLQNPLGSIMSGSTSMKDRLGYIKTLVAHTPENPDEKSPKFPVLGLVLLPSSGFILFVIVIGILCWRRNRILKAADRTLDRCESTSSAELEVLSIAGLPVRFDFEELAAATENFKTQIGRGGFGMVYKGTLPDGTVVAVKKITNLGVQGKKEFCTEIAIIGNIHHFNLVRLKGFCAQGRQRFLVYEYMNRGSLDRTLFGSGPVLEWQERFKIALGTARGLAYLHSGCEPKIIHCDVKPENILLHDYSQVKITDFGLSKLLSPEQSTLFTAMRGTRGYLAPEWLTRSAISDKADVYSYGMVLLEIVSGRKNSSSLTSNQSTEKDSASPSSGLNLRSMYFPLLALEMHEQRRYLELADPRLEGRVLAEEVEKLVRIALSCVHEEPSLRPSMTNVVGMLEGGVALSEPRIQSLNFLRSYGRSFTKESRMETCNKQNEFEMFTRVGAMFNSTTTSGSYNSLSYISSQDVSGPR
ncbi:hypothetical protein FNV43_RR13903 [Rhamnella rubrinervis]|uniref:Receptor-like serine/threonine-protein kinase n=1 Tax=Rhamnella rubrinervis TaxID=2594499 RepID=A0A8K0H224_9ROSA|nr:hypothetical protein FNV43_RR13903 [Rhamnella rubrinervis]